MRKMISFILITTGLFGLILAMNENANYLNFVGANIFGLSCYFGAKHARGLFHPIDYLINFWRL